MITAIALCLLYFGGVLAGVALVGPLLAPWYLAVLSIAFVWCYRVLAKGKAAVALVVVLIVTIALPIGALFAIALPIYESWSASAASLWAAFQERGVRGGIELLVPLAAAAGCAGVVGRRRSNIAVNPGQPPADGLP